MRKLGPIALGLALASIVACDGTAPPNQASDIADSPVDPSVFDTAAETALIDGGDTATELYDKLNLLQLELEQNREYLDSLIDRLSAERENWTDCTAYLTNNAAAGFCEAEPPANWRPFMFNDQLHFVVPLGPSA